MKYISQKDFNHQYKKIVKNGTKREGKKELRAVFVAFASRMLRAN
jgi:hypothetical protein